MRLKKYYSSEVSQIKKTYEDAYKKSNLIQMYKQTIQTDWKNNFVKPVEMQASSPQSILYLTHHPVTNPNKSGKVRRVANAASQFRGKPLNSNLLTGSNLLNSLSGVLLRFREHLVAVLSDTEGTFIQSSV